jgi:aconitate hydratase
VLAKSFARIHRDNLANFGIVPLVFADPEDCNDIAQGDVLRMTELHKILAGEAPVMVENVTRGRRYAMLHGLSKRQVAAVLAGGLINCVKSAVDF